jgi:hypothetical protein
MYTNLAPPLDGQIQTVVSLLGYIASLFCAQEAKYMESWPNTTSAWAGWSRFDIPVDRYG